MVRSLSRLFMIAAAAAALSIASLAPSSAPIAATAVPGIATAGVQVIPLHFQGQYDAAATTTAAARFKMPFEFTILGVSASARASGGTTPTLTVNLKDDGTSVFTAPVAVTAGAVAEATLDSTKVKVADESVMTIDLVVGGTNPTWDDIDVLITIVRN